MFEPLIRQVQNTETVSRTGKVENIVGMSIEASGGRAAVGDICRIYNGESGKQVPAEVVGFKNDHILLMPYEDMSGISAGNFVRNTGRQLTLRIGSFLRGRIINALGQPIDGLGPFEGGDSYCVGGGYINPLSRPLIREKMEFGVKAIDGMLTVGKGQRIGIFAGSGVGKSTLMGMIAKNVKADINVIALVGERGREVLEFVQKDLGEEGMRRSILVVATSDQPAMLRMQCPSVATGIAEYFRDQGYGRAADDGFADPLRHGPAGDRSGGGRAAGGPGLHPLHLRRAAQAAGAQRQLSKKVPSPGSTPCWWRATTPTSPLPTRCGAFWMDTSSFPVSWPTATTSLPSTSAPASPA